MANMYLATAALGGSDANNGLTVGAPKLTLTAALAAMSAGDTCVTRGGTYSSTYDLTSSHSGTSGNPKTVTNTVGETPIFSGAIQFTSTSHDIKFLGNADCRFNHAIATIKFTFGGAQHTIQWYGQRNEVNGCIIDHSEGTGFSCVGMGYAGGPGSTYFEVGGKLLNCYLRGLQDWHSVSNPGHDHGVYMNANDGTEVAYNVFDDMADGWAVHLYAGDPGVTGGDVQNCHIHHNTMVGNRNGAVQLGGADPVTTLNVNVEYNLAVDAGRTPATYTGSVYSFQWFQSGSLAGSGTGSNNYSHNPKTTHVDPGLAGHVTFTSTVTAGDPLFVDKAAGDYRLQAGSPAVGYGALNAPVDANLSGTVAGVGVASGTPTVPVTPPALVVLRGRSMRGF